MRKLAHTSSKQLALRAMYSGLLMSCLLLSNVLFANNIQVSNVALSGQDTTQGTVLVDLDLSWENSWRYSINANINNWDAAWVFVKFRVGGADYASAAGASSSGNVITVNSTRGLRVGMPVWVASGTGTLAAESRVASILSSTQFEVSVTPSVALSGSAVVGASRIWEHAWLGDVGEHQAGTGTALTYESGFVELDSAFNIPNNPSLGLLLYRSGEGYGTVSQTGIGLRWHYEAQGVGDDDIVEVQVHALEMVFVPAGAFSLGDGSSSDLRGQLRDGEFNSPFRVGSEAALTLGGTVAGQLANNNATGMLTGDDFDNSTTQTLPAAFPKGYAAFYAMKHEISQQQYVDFLNTLNRLQQDNHTETALAAGTTSITNRYVMSGTAGLSNRNGIRCAATVDAQAPIVFYCDLNGNGTGGEAADGMFIAANWLEWSDLAAFLDWAALRPLSELEYEKMAHGQQSPSVGAYAWGSSSITQAANISNAGQASEFSNTVDANAVYGDAGSVPGPMRVGVFADSATSRTAASAGFYGFLELSGNVAELLVTVGQADGRSFTARQGDGVLIDTGTNTSLYGTADVATWPGVAALGQGSRGGSWEASALDLRVADRRTAAAENASRSATIGGRGARAVACAVPTGTVVVTGNSIPVGANATFGASGAGSDYFWIVPSDWEIVSGQGTDTIEVYAKTAGVLRVAAYNGCGSGPETSVNVSLE